MSVTFSTKMYQRFFPHDCHHMDGFADAVQHHMLQSSQVLDLGCGDNSILAGYRSADRAVWGTDFEMHPRLQDPQWFRPLGSDGKILFPDATFDLVVCISVLEHVTDGEVFLREVVRVLKPSGVFIGHSISGDHYVTWIRRIVGLLPHSINQRIVKKLYGRDEIDTFPAAYRLNRQSAIDRAGRSAGLYRIALLRYADQGYFSIWPWIVPVVIMIDGLLARVSSGCGRLYFTVLMKKHPV